MVGQLEKFKRDPNGKGRGAGMYYHRGNGVYSKYSPHRDAVIRTPVTKVRKIAHSERVEPHKGDYKSARDKTYRTGHTGTRGYF